MSRLLILGGSGFLSGHMTRIALAAGHETWVLTRGQRPVTAGARMIVADRKDREAFAHAVAAAGTTWDGIIDCIGFSADDARQDVEVFAGRAGHLVFISTDFVYAVPRPWRIDETFDRFESELTYGRGKREAERVILAAGSKIPATVLRPCHIYGPGSLLGCLPEHGRDPKLLERLRAGDSLNLVGRGHFLQQPVYAEDLAHMALSAIGNDRAVGGAFHAAGPDVIESSEYYRIIAKVLGVQAFISETPTEAHLAENPGHRPFCCHRVYDMTRAQAAGLRTPATPVQVGLAAHVASTF